MGATDAASHARHYICQQCNGWVVAIAVLRKLVVSGIAGQIWNGEEAQNDAVGPCPFCRRPMEGRPVAAGNAAICKTCQVIWLDRTALSALPAATTTPLAAAEHEARCENCGAYAASPYDEKCRYCGTSLGPATKVVMVPVEAPSPARARLGDAALAAYGAGQVIQGAASLLDLFQ